VEAMFFERQSKCSKDAQKRRLRRAFLKIHRKYFSLANGKASVCKKMLK
jgi:hypothetical protein